jgi:hypothetical protein
MSTREIALRLGCAVIFGLLLGLDYQGEIALAPHAGEEEQTEHSWTPAAAGAGCDFTIGMPA